MYRFLIVAFSLIFPAQAALAEDLCAAAAEVVAGRACAQSAHGIVIADDPARAQEVLDNAEAGVRRFALRFGQTPARYAVVEVGDGRVEGDTLSALEAAGFEAVLPWLSQAGFRAQIEQSVRRAIAEQTAGMPDEVREPLVQEALAKVLDRPQAGGQEPGAIPHELGHMWYAQAFWPGSDHKGGHYGGEGPDWMDETAAVLMESEALGATRVEGFRKRYLALRADGKLEAAMPDRLLDLPGFFASTHPGAERGEKMIAAMRAEDPGALPKNGIVIRASSGPEAERFADEAIHYYLQATLAGEYLAARSGDPAIFAAIGAAFGRGETMAQWLAANGASKGLPATLPAIQADWLAWLAQRFAEPSGS